MIGLLLVTILNTLTTTETILSLFGSVDPEPDIILRGVDPEPVLILDPGVGPGILVVADRVDWIPLWLALARGTRLHIWREQ